MLTITRTPPLVGLIGNPIRFIIHSDNTIESAAVQSRINIDFSDNGTEDHSIHLVWGSVDITLTCKPVPDNSGIQIPDATVVANLNDWVQLVAEYMLRNYYINRDWTIIVSGSSILMLGKLSNVGTPVVTFNWQEGSEPIGSTVTGELVVSRVFYKIGLQLLIKQGSVWELIGEDLIPVDGSGDAVVDIHSVFADRIYPEFTWPEKTSLTFMDIRTHSSIEYRIQYYEQYGNPLIPGILTRTDSYYALAGGVSKSQEAIYNRQGSSFWLKMTYNQYFLTWQPKVKQVSVNQVEKLFFLAQTEMTRITCYVNFYYLDGTSQLSAAFSANDLPPDKGVIELTVSPAILLQAATYPTRVNYYEVWIECQAERISEIRTYYIDYSTYENPRYFLFRNSLGGYDTLRTTGGQEDMLEYNRVSINKILAIDFTELDHEATIGSVSESMVYKANTGWKKREEISWLRDFFLSKQVFLINVNKLVPIIVTTTEASQRIDKEDLFSLEFGYRRSYESEYYSREIVTAEFTDDFDDDFPNE